MALPKKYMAYKEGIDQGKPCSSLGEAIAYAGKNGSIFYRNLKRGTSTIVHYEGGYIPQKGGLVI